MRRVVSILCLLILFSGLCSCNNGQDPATEPDTPGIAGTTAASEEGPSFSVDTTEDTVPETKAAVTTTAPATTVAPTTEPETEPRVLTVTYVGPERFERERVEIKDLQVRVMQGEEILEENPAGWNADLYKLLEVGDNTFTITYDGLSCDVIVPAAAGMKDGNTSCDVDVASSKALSGQKPLVSALKYLSVAYKPEKSDPFSVMALNGSELTLTQRSALFVREIYGKHGIRLPYTAEEIETYGAEVSRDQVRVGDLVKFTDMKTEGESSQTLLGIYVGGDFVLSLNADHKADFYWMHETTCRRLFDNTCEMYGEESFVYVMDAFKDQKIYGEWVTSYVDDVPYIIGRVRNFFFTVDLSSCVDGYYPTYFCYDDFQLPEVFVEHWKQEYLKKNALCEVMKNGEYIRFDAAGNYHFKVDCDRETWKSLTPGVYGEYWNMDWSFLME